MKYSHMVRVVKRVGERANHPSHRGRVHAMVVSIPPERPARHQLICNPASASVKPRVMHSHDVRGDQTGRRSRLREKPFHHPLIRFQELQDLDRNITVQSRVKRPVDLPETAVAEPLTKLESPPATDRPTRVSSAVFVARRPDSLRGAALAEGKPSGNVIEFLISGSGSLVASNWLESMGINEPQCGHKLPPRSASCCTGLRKTSARTTSAHNADREVI